MRAREKHEAVDLTTARARPRVGLAFIVNPCFRDWPRGGDAGRQVATFWESLTSMPLPVAHGLLGAALVAAIHPEPTRRHFTPLVVGALLANAADFDFALVFILRSKAWHRGFSHSIIFALIVGLTFVLLLGRRRIREALAYGAGFASHAALDYVTTKEGGGVELLWPFSSGRLVFGRVGLSELPSRMAATDIVMSLVLELALFAPLLLLAVSVRKYLSKGGRVTEGAV